MAPTKRLALVTGANRGIGLATVDLFAKKGFDVILSCRDADAAAQVVGPMRTRGLPVQFLQLDVGALTAAQLAEVSGRPIDVLINNAGFYPAANDVAALRTAFEVHVLGPMSLIQAVLPGMQARGYGRIVNLSSGHGSFSEGLEGPLPYSVSKAALNALTVKLSREAGPSVKVNALCPGWVRTRMGGEAAPISPAAAADNVFWLGTLPADGPSGGFFRDRHRIGF